ncbi:hypothetical protein DV735_g1166, partial [Chaetothyriales sp. CBS 134920]
MSMKILINDFPHRSVAIATDHHALIFRHTPAHEHHRYTSSTSLPLPNAKPGASTPRCMVEFTTLPSENLSSHRNVGAARGALGLIALNGDVFISVVTGSVEVATLRPGETVQRIYAVEFYCLNRSDYDYSHGYPPKPYNGQTFAADDLDYSIGHDAGETVAEHPFQALQKLLTSGSFYYSQDFDLTRRIQDRGGSGGILDISRLDENLLWNSYMINPLLKFRSRLANLERNALDASRMLTSVIRGFARTLSIAPSTSPIQHKKSSQPATLTVISRLSSRRAGTRFNSRGIDDNGHVANFVETETVFCTPSGLCFSYSQTRGSVPIFWESSSSLIPGQQKIHITRSPEATQPSFDKHFASLEQAYGAIHVLNLLSNSRPGELELSQRYRYHIGKNPLTTHNAGEEEEHELLMATHFDFNHYTQGAGGYEGAQAIRPLIESSLEAFVYFLSEDIEEWITERGKPKLVKRPAVIMQQNGIFRVNCLDCLDRTNLVQTMISRMVMENFLSHRAERANSDFWMRHSTLWADNGDALSRIYAGTGALKSSFTRHGKMSLAGALADARKSATRLYVNHFEDKNRQNVVDLLLGRLYAQSSVELFDPVNDWVIAELNKYRSAFESRETINIFVGSYNLNGQTTGSSEDLSPWFDLRADDCGIVVVGFQEIVELSPQQIMSTDPNRRMVWESAVRDYLNNHLIDKSGNDADLYVLLRSGQLVGAALLIFVKSSLIDRITNVEGAVKKTGMSGIAGNKGAVAIRMEIDSTSVCFVTAHLAAGFANYDERNRDYNTITSGLRFQRDRKIEDHEVIIWAGDFNYRIGLSHDKARSLVDSAAIGGPKSELALEKLYENDQLNIQMVAGNCFPFYCEGRVTFLPTYKFDLGKDEYDTSDKQRIPAWTDRILFKVNHDTLVQGEELGTRLKQVEYSSVMAMRFSDHKPIYSIFQLGVRVVDEVKRDELTKKLYKKRAREVKAEDHEHDHDEDESDLEETIGYKSIQEGLPPASSDRRKWWLDDHKGAASHLTPPGPNMVLNPKRSGNPWRDGAEEEDWVQVERPHSSSVASASPPRAPSLKQKPQPPPARRTKGKATASASEDETGADGADVKNVGADAQLEARSASTSPPPPPPRSSTEPTRTPSVASLTSTSTMSVSRKPPPKPLKPTALSSATTQGSEAGTKPLNPAPQGEGSSLDAQPPPLPARATVSETVAPTRRPLPPPINPTAPTWSGITPLQDASPLSLQPRNVSKLLQSDGRERGSSVSSAGSAPSSLKPVEEEQKPALPPRRGETDNGLMDHDDEAMKAVEWEAITPSK